MAKRQNFIVGSTNVITQSLTDSELNHGFDQYEILTAEELDGVFNSVSDFSNDASNEIANAIQSITGLQPTGATQTELANALQQMRNEIETTSLTFKGYVATSAPSSSTYALVEGNIWINSATMPTSFPVAASSIKQWNGTSWVNYGSTYTPKDFDFFRNINDNEGYYWFGGVWTVMSTDMSTTYFTLNQSTGKWEIKSNVNLPGAPTTTTPASTDKSTKIATTQYVHDTTERFVSNCLMDLPQDINLTLVSGTLTLKSGSKVYVPNGAGVFDTLNISEDKVCTVAASNQQVFVCISADGTTFSMRGVNDSVSGAGATTTGGYAYDTTTNLIKYYNSGGVAQYNCSFPIAICTVDSSQVVSIDQVFNGFGYIGSTIFGLPNIKGLAPNGRNADGTLKSTLIAPTSLLSRTFVNSGNFYIGLQGAGFGAISSSNYTYDSESNIQYSSGTPFSNSIVVISCTLTSGVVSNFKVLKNAFRAADYGDTVFKSVDQDIDSEKTMLGADSFRFIGNNSYGTVFRASNDKFYMLLTNQNDQRGTWNALRPFSLDCATGSIATITQATTDESTKIATTAFVKAYAIGLPDWTNATAITNDTPYTATTNGYVIASGFTDADALRDILYINGTAVLTNQDNHYGGSGQICVPIAKGDVYKVYFDNMNTGIFVPCKNL